MDVVNVKIKQDDSVQKLIEKTAQKLQNKYSKKRKINEKLLKSKNRGMEIISRILSILCIVLVTVSALLFISIVNSLTQHVATSFAGFTSMKVGSGSMTASGFKKGDNVIAKSVDTHTLKEGDIIAFYRYWDISNSFDTSKMATCKVDTTNIGEPKYKVTFAQFFGSQNATIQNAAKAKSDIIFHKIYEVYEVDGVRWFRTYGTSNFNADGTQQIDNWYVREDLILGTYNDSGFARVISGMLQLFSSSRGIVLALVVPLVLIGCVILLQFMRDIQILKLQLDVVEEKRKITDPICVKYDIGYRMDNKMKYKVLAQADDKQKNEYISLLWKEGKAPENIRKYCLRKKMYLKPVEKLLEINRICQDKLNNGEDPKQVAEYYLREKKALQKEQLIFERKFRKWVKDDKKNWVSDEELEYDDKDEPLKDSSQSDENVGEKAVEKVNGKVDEKIEEKVNAGKEVSATDLPLNSNEKLNVEVSGVGGERLSTKTNSKSTKKASSKDKGSQKAKTTDLKEKVKKPSSKKTSSATSKGTKKVTSKKTSQTKTPKSKAKVDKKSTTKKASKESKVEQ